VFLVMECVDGQNLRAWATEKPRRWSEFQHVFVQAARGLAAVHAAGIVHGDVKPENVLVGRDGRVRVSDFGLASAVDDGLVGAGTPGYFAPERRQGRPADSSADQWALCWTFCEMLTGGTTLEGDGQMVGPTLEAMVRARRPPAAAKRAIMRGLSSSPEARFRSVTDLADALESPPRRRGLRLAAALMILTLAFFAALGVRTRFGTATLGRSRPAPKYATGSFCWAELAANDVGREKSFYAALFGWRFEDSPHPIVSTYTAASNQSGTVAGFYQLTSEQRSRGIQPQWLSYVAVADADDRVRQAASLGARVRMAPRDSRDLLRLAVVVDPGGAPIGVWQPRRLYGATFAAGTLGTWVWHESAAEDPSHVADFYDRWLGWNIDRTSSDAYLISRAEEPARAVIRRATEGEFPRSRWIIDFAVSDCDTAVERAVSLGAVVMQPAVNVPHLGRRAILADPDGAPFGVVSTARSSDAL
jgi:predicted enzyme related to lactoylglutathione lyase